MSCIFIDYSPALLVTTVEMNAIRQVNVKQELLGMLSYLKLPLYYFQAKPHSCCRPSRVLKALTRLPSPLLEGDTSLMLQIKDQREESVSEVLDASRL